MKEEAIRLVRGIEDSAQRLNILREYLQALMLRSLHESEGFRCLAFVGGTALRFLHQLPRFSEDLDFSLVSDVGYDPEKWMAKVKRDLTLAGWDTVVIWNGRKTVNTAWIKVGGVLKEVGLAAMPQQKLSIKLEVDTHPPEGGITRNQVVEKHRTFVLNAYDLSSLMAGKLHALITRKYPKGRDWYDFVWYTAQRPSIEPNLIFLQNALDQTQGAGVFDSGQWRQYVKERIETLDMKKMRDDVSLFLERRTEVDVITKDNILSLLQKRMIQE